MISPCRQNVGGGLRRLGRPGSLRRAFTLIELTASIVTMSILLVAIGSAIVLAGRAVPSANSPVAEANSAAGAVTRMCDELSQAVHVTEHTDNAVTFTVADRDGDGSPETIRYAWSGSSGQPLTRSFNYGSEEVILPEVHALTLTFETKVVAEVYPGSGVESAEGVLIGYNSKDELDEAAICDKAGLGQYFLPSLPADAIVWKVTRVSFQARRDDDTSIIEPRIDDTSIKVKVADTSIKAKVADTSIKAKVADSTIEPRVADSTMTIRMRLPSADNLPNGWVLDSATVAKSSLGTSFKWVERSFADAAAVTAGQALYLTFTTDNRHAGVLRYQDEDVETAGLGLRRACSDWGKLRTDQSLLFNVYGTVTTPGPTQTATRTYITAVGLSIQTRQGQDASRVVSTVRPTNAPEVLSAVWETHFDSDPTALDINADAQTDWADVDGGSFDTDTLVGGVWQADLKLRTTPDNNFTELTTVDVRFRGTAVDHGPAVRINGDHSGGNFGPVWVGLVLQADTTQTLTIYKMTAPTTSVALLTIGGLAGDFVDLRLLIDPGPDTVNVRVNGRDRGTYEYDTFATAGAKRCVKLFPQGDGAEFDHVKVRVGGTGE